MAGAALRHSGRPHSADLRRVRRSAYGTTNLLIGTPLAYQYLTSLRPDALPATTDDLLRMRGRGWLAQVPAGQSPRPIAACRSSTARWDTGVQVHGVNGIVEWTGSVTTGSLSNPRVDDDNDGRQMAGRAVVRPMAAVAVGASVARGAFLSRRPRVGAGTAAPVEDGVQQAFGVDAEYRARAASSPAAR